MQGAFCVFICPFVNGAKLCHNVKMVNYTVGHKKHGILLLSIPSPIIDQFSKFFYRHTLQTICNNLIIVYPNTR